MRRILCATGLAVLVVTVGAAGCSKQAVREKPLPDPLLTSKKPVEGRPHTGDAPPPRDEIPPPPLPPEASVQATAPPAVQLLSVRPVR